MATVVLDIKDPSTIVTPAAGTVELFLDSTNSNHLSYMDSSRVVKDLQEEIDGDDDDCCVCDIQTSYWASITCALNSGMITAEQFQAIVAAGFSSTNTKVTDDAGNITCQAASGVILVPVVSVDVSPDSPSPLDLSSSPTLQLTAIVLPPSATQAVIYVSSDTLIATVSATGLITGIGVGAATIYIYSVSDLTKYYALAITVQA